MFPLRKNVFATCEGPYLTLPEAENRVVSAIRLILSVHEANQTSEKSAYLIDIHMATRKPAATGRL